MILLKKIRFPDKFHNCRLYVEEKLKAFLETKNYGSEVNELAIIPIIVKLSEDMEKAGWFKERKLFKRKEKSTDFRLRIDYEKFSNGTDEDRVKLLIKNIIDSVRILSKRAKKDFKGKYLYFYLMFQSEEGSSSRTEKPYLVLEKE